MGDVVAEGPKEKRKLKRFDLKVPGRVTSGSKIVECSVLTRDISSGGAFVDSPFSLPDGAGVILELILSVKRPVTSTGNSGHTRVTVSGRVLRSDDRGMAIQFEGKYLMEPFITPPSQQSSYINV